MDSSVRMVLEEISGGLVPLKCWSVAWGGGEVSFVP